ncbi:hypothetical protein HNY73_003623 [Argiope bruennichi]|uniref:Uncharacterized protein n=1 Tax=Argiope bruennichi TaxID=94029 RepID=A0A8T0FNP6_ARGBR|nr:hypothetical protein HNY73_003623 [Argiope bruennichi]
MKLVSTLRERPSPSTIVYLQLLSYLFLKHGSRTFNAKDNSRSVQGNHNHPHIQQPRLPQQISLQQSNKLQHHMLTKSVRQAANNSESGMDFLNEYYN